MKDRLLNQLDKLIQILEICSLAKQKEWTQEQLKIIKKNPIISNDFQDALQNISENLTGMGSISDVPVYPQKESSLSSSEASEMLWDIVTSIDQSIIDLKDSQTNH